VEEIIPTEQTSTTEENKPRMVWAAVILTLLFPGLGHIYCGEIKRGIGLFVSAIITVSALFVLLGLFPNIITLIILFTGELSILICFLYDAVRIAQSKKEYYLRGYNKWYLYILIIIAGSFLVTNIYLPFITNNIVQSYSEPSVSMENTILAGDHFFVNTFTYKIGDSKPRINDVVAFELEGLRDEVKSDKRIKYLKRIAGLPGDTIKLENYVLYVNNHIQPIPTFAVLPSVTNDHTVPNPKIFPNGSLWNEENYGPVIIPKRNDIIHLNVNNLEQWKIFIEREKHSISAKDSTILIDDKPANEYKVERNYYFMLGDGRYLSLDSRYYGFIPEGNIIGQATIIYWSWEDSPRIALYDQFQTIRWDRIGKEIK